MYILTSLNLVVMKVLDYRYNNIPACPIYYHKCLYGKLTLDSFFVILTVMRSLNSENSISILFSGIFVHLYLFFLDDTDNPL